MTDREIDLQVVPTAPFRPTPAHELLATMQGSWRGPSRLWLDPTAPPEESTTALVARSILGGRWLRLEYSGTAMGKPHAGEMLLGFHRDARAFELATIDSFHTGTSIMLSAGPLRDDGVAEVLGHYDAGGERWGWRTSFTLQSADLLLVEAWNIWPAGREDRAFEMRLSRT